MIEKYITDNNVLNIYQFGSRVYESHNKDSDYDYILIAKEYFDPKDINIHVHTIENFQQLLDNHDIQTLECYFLPDKYILKYNYSNFTFILDKSKLRTSISTISSNSWVKGKKKLIVQGDYDVNLAIKSLYHSLRIINFGIQIALHGKIIDYTSYNYILTDLRKLAEQYQSVELWNAIDTKYRELYNKSRTHFKKLCPKENNELYDLVKKYFIDNNIDYQLTNDKFNELKNIFSKNL
jgi:hypothetical protein